MHPWIARHLFYYPILALRGERLYPYLREVRAFNRLSPEQMQTDQWRRLRVLLEYVYQHSPYNREKFDQHGISPANIQSPDDFAKIPLLTKDEIRKHSARMASTEKRRISHRHTSGSTGMPLDFVKDHDSLAYMNAIMHDCYSWHGIEIGDRQCRIWGLPRELKRQISIYTRDFLLNRIRLSSFDVSDQSSTAFYHKVRRFRPKFMYGVPSYMTELALRLRRLGFNPADLRLHAIVATGEILYPEQKQLMKEAYACPIVNEYGTTECGIIAFACPSDQMHVMSHNIYLEVVDPATGREVGPGETGEVVITDLTSYAMPFVRYHLGDIVERKESPCPCGLHLPMLGHIEGRLEDMLTTPEGKKVAGGMFYYTLTKGIRKFKVYQRAIDRLEVYLEKGPDFDQIDLNAIREKWKVYLGPRMNVTFQIVEEIPADKSGKFRYFVSELPPAAHSTQVVNDNPAKE
ncbi:MAG: AMP-binding protein [Candidatus Zixiibacteriota bacterium]